MDSKKKILFSVISALAVIVSVNIVLNNRKIKEAPFFIQKILSQSIEMGSSESREITNIVLESFPNKTVSFELVNDVLFKYGFEVLNKTDSKGYYRYECRSSPFCRCIIYIDSESSVSGSIRVYMSTRQICI